MKEIVLITCTRFSETEFWEKSKLAPYITMQLSVKNIDSVHVVYSNTEGIGKCYNRFITEANKDKILLLVHDDIELYNIDLKQRLNDALSVFDIIGLAGNNVHNPIQSPVTWMTGKMENMITKSGQVAHEGKFKIKRNGVVADTVLTTMNYFGPSNMNVKVIDGVFIAINMEKCYQHKFDEQFDFHMYDLDYSYSAHTKGLKVGTWDIYIKHYSGGAYYSESWKLNEQKYITKWSK